MEENGVSLIEKCPPVNIKGEEVQRTYALCQYLFEKDIDYHDILYFYRTGRMPVHLEAAFRDNFDIDRLGQAISWFKEFGIEELKEKNWIGEVEDQRFFLYLGDYLARMRPEQYGRLRIRS